jgi:ribosomal protein S18 acetylase RimI-like enzyme
VAVEGGGRCSVADLVVVRCLARSEAALLDAVAPDVFDHEVRPAYLRAFLDDPHSHLAVAIDDGVVVGMASGLVHGHPDKPWQLFVNEVGVAPSHQRRGLGRALVRCLLERGRELGCRVAWVATEVDNAPARALYLATGGREDDDLAVVYTYPLDPDGVAAGDAAGAADGSLRGVALRSEALLAGARVLAAADPAAPVPAAADLGPAISADPAADPADAIVLLVKHLTDGAGEVRHALAPIATEEDWAAYAQERALVELEFGVGAARTRRMVEAMRRRAATLPLRWSFVWAGGERVGAVGLLTFDGGTAGRLQDVDVFPRYRGRGFGRLLLRAIEADAAASGCRCIVVGADSDGWTRGWYEREGYRAVAAVRRPPA